MRLLEDVIEQAMESRLAAVWTALPGRVKAFDAASSTCTVQPFPSVWEAGDAVAMPAIADVPVTYPSGGGSSMTWPLEAGDFVLLVFSTLPLGRFRADGADGNPVDTRRFDLSDAWALPLKSGNQPPATAGRTVIRQPTLGKIQVGTGGVTPAAARVGDSVGVVIGPTQGAAFQAWMLDCVAWVTAGSPNPPPADFTLQGTIVSGSSTVEVA